jgi:hypothetical protein
MIALAMTATAAIKYQGIEPLSVAVFDESVVTVTAILCVVFGSLLTAIV